MLSTISLDDAKVAFMNLKYVLSLAVFGIISCAPPQSKTTSNADKSTTEISINEKPSTIAPARNSTWLTEKQPSSIKPYNITEQTGIRTYIRYRALSKQWGIKCVNQTTGRSLAPDKCVLNPLSGEVYPRSGIHAPAKNGIEIVLNEPDFPHIYFFPSNMRKNSSYSITCGEHVYNGAFGSKKSLPAFQGKEAKDIVEAMMKNSGCEAKFVNFGLGPISTWVQTNGLTDGVIYAENWLREISE